MPTSIITRGSGVSIAGRQSRGLSPAFSRASAAYQSDGRLVGVGVPRFETVGGRRGVLVEAGTTNRAINRLFVNPTAEWVSGVGITRSSRVTDTPFGVRPVLVVDGAAAIWIALAGAYKWTLPGADKPVALSMWMRNLGSTSGTPSFYLGVGYRTAEDTLPVGGEWIQVRRTFQPGEYVANGLLHWFKGVAGQVEVCAIQVEYGRAYATSFVDGTRAAEVLSLPESVWSPDTGAFVCCVKVAGSSISKTITLQWDQTGSPASRFGLWIDSDGAVTFNFAGSSTDSRYIVRSIGRVDDNQWHHCAATWDQRAVTLFIDGVVAGYKIVPTRIQNDGGRRGGVIPIGRRGWTYNDEYLDGLISDLRIYPRALSAAEIAAHAAGNIVASDCFHYPFDGDLWPAPRSLGAVIAPAVATRPGQVDVATRHGSVDIITRPGKLEVVKR